MCIHRLWQDDDVPARSAKSPAVAELRNLKMAVLETPNVRDSFQVLTEALCSADKAIVNWSGAHPEGIRR